MAEEGGGEAGAELEGSKQNESAIVLKQYGVSLLSDRPLRLCEKEKLQVEGCLLWQQYWNTIVSGFADRVGGTSWLAIRQGSRLEAARREG